MTGLPTETYTSGAWYADVGLGDALHEPIPLTAGEYHHKPFTLQMTRAPEAAAGWHLKHDQRGGFAGMAWTDKDATWSDFTAQHRLLSTSPDSGFVRIGVAQGRDATGVDVVGGLTIIRASHRDRDVGRVTGYGGAAAPRLLILIPNQRPSERCTPKPAVLRREF